MNKAVKSESDGVLVRLNTALWALSQAKTLQEAKHIADVAEAARVYAKRSKLGKDVESHASEIILRAERLLGEMLIVAPKNKGANGSIVTGSRRVPVKDQTPTLFDSGIDKKLSSRAQALAEIPEEVFESTLQSRKASGRLTRFGLIRDFIQSKKIAEAKRISALTTNTVVGVFDVLVIDPPWPTKKSVLQDRWSDTQIGFDYPTMSLDTLHCWPLPKQKAANDCHVFLWTTHKYLFDAFECLKSWDFKYACTFVWHKAGGMQFPNAPQLNCEFVLYARKGNPVFVNTKNFRVCFEGKRGGHSTKPAEFYETISRVTVGRRLDLFARRSIDGFVGWGLEATKYHLCT
jgi:N6-adenosine-specific RNA methylase IME4